MLIVIKSESMGVARIESPRPFRDFSDFFFQEISLGDLWRFQPCQPISGVFDFGLARIGVFPKIIT
jgi:hypothetical protein